MIKREYLSECGAKCDGRVPSRIGMSSVQGNIYMLFAGWEVRIVKNCDRGLENAARGRRPRAAFSRPRSQFFTIRTDPKPVNNLFFFLRTKKLFQFL